MFSQETILCTLQNDYIKIESTDNIPTTTNNPDNTITLTHLDQNITDIFADYTIYDFYQAFPNANPDGELIKYYTIVHGNRALINELHNYLPSESYSIELYPTTALNSELINLLDNKTYKLIKYCTESTEGGLPCPEGEYNIPEDFQLNIAFEYDAENDIMNAETAGLSSCGNSFSIKLKGQLSDELGTSNNRLQLWESQLGVSTLTDNNQPCHSIEYMVYSVLDIGCQVGYNYGNIRFNIDTGNAGEFIIERENAVFATDFLTFRDNELSIDENLFESMRIFQTNGNPYLQISNLDNHIISVEVFNTLGQSIVKTKRFTNTSLNVSEFNEGLYFIKLSTQKTKEKVFKFFIHQ